MEPETANTSNVTVRRYCGLGNHILKTPNTRIRDPKILHFSRKINPELQHDTPLCTSCFVTLEKIYKLKKRNARAHQARKQAESISHVSSRQRQDVTSSSYCSYTSNSSTAAAELRAKCLELGVILSESTKPSQPQAEPETETEPESAPGFVDVELNPLCGVQSQANAITIESASTISTPTPTVTPTPTPIPTTTTITTTTPIQTTTTTPVADISSCPPTQLNDQSTSSADMPEVDPASQMPDPHIDPLMESMRVPVKQEASQVKFLDKMRSRQINSEEFLWENINTEDEIINLDESQDSLSNMACFAIRKATEVPTSKAVTPPQCSESDSSNQFPEEELPETQHAVIETEEEAAAGQEELAQSLSETETVSVPVAMPKQKKAAAIPFIVPPKRKLKIPAPNEVLFKKPRMMNEWVPQLRHEFRPLPLHALVPIESPDFDRSVENEQPTTSSAHVDKETTITPSQDFASGNSLLASSQLDALLDAPNVTRRKVNNDATVEVRDENINKEPPPVLQSYVIFRDIERFRFFSALTNEQIIKHMIEGHFEGSAYQDALIRANGKLCNVRGPLIETLFPYLSARLRSDLMNILRNLREFQYNCRRDVYKDSKQDLRVRVLSIFMNLAPKFVHFGVQYDNDTRERATCQSVYRDPHVYSRPPRCDLLAALKPGILERMKAFKEQLR